MGTATSPHWIAPQARQVTLVFGRFAASWPKSLDELDSTHPLAISTNPTNHPHRSMGACLSRARAARQRGKRDRAATLGRAPPRHGGLLHVRGEVRQLEHLSQLDHVAVRGRTASSPLHCFPL